MSRRGIRLVFAVVVAAVVVAAFAVGRMTGASAQTGMRRSPSRRLVRPTTPARTLVTVRGGQGDAAETAGRPDPAPTRAAPALLSRSTLSGLVGSEVGDAWLDLYPRRPCIPYKGHMNWYRADRFLSTTSGRPNGFVYAGSPAAESEMEIYVRPQVEGARYLVDCSVYPDKPLRVSFSGREYMVPPMTGHLVFMWETGPARDSDEGLKHLRIGSPDGSWVFLRCQLTFLGGPE